MAADIEPDVRARHAVLARPGLCPWWGLKRFHPGRKRAIRRESSIIVWVSPIGSGTSWRGRRPRHDAGADPRQEPSRSWVSLGLGCRPKAGVAESLGLNRRVRPEAVIAVSTGVNRRIRPFAPIQR